MQFKNEVYEANIETHIETTRDSLKRSRVMASLNESKIDPEDEHAAYFWHPIAISCSTGTLKIIESDGTQSNMNVRDLSLEQFLNMPAELWNLWVPLLMESNPHLFSFNEVDSKKN